MNATKIKTSLEKGYKKLINVVEGPDFNRSAHESMATSHHTAIATTSPVSRSEEGEEEEDWAIVKTTPKSSPYPSEPEPFLVKEGPSVEKICTAALETATVAAGFSKEYSLLALKYLTLETARDVGWMVNCRKTGQLMKGVQERFPFLGDVRRAYEEGAKMAGFRRELLELEDGESSRRRSRDSVGAVVEGADASIGEDVGEDIDVGEVEVEDLLRAEAEEFAAEEGGGEEDEDEVGDELATSEDRHFAEIEDEMFFGQDMEGGAEEEMYADAEAMVVGDDDAEE